MSPLPYSGSKADKLSQRLRHAERIHDDDLDLLLELLRAYQEALDHVQHRLRSLGYAPTSRTKTTGVLVDKLKREQTSLKSVQDIAGARIVEDCDRDEQDTIVAAIVREFANEAKPPRIRDRRSDPSHGYRAVHVIVTALELPVEIQVRTFLQDQWAQIVESLGDKWGRGVRYGEQPPVPEQPVVGAITQVRFWRIIQDLAERTNEIEAIRVSLNGLERDHEEMASRGVRTEEEESAAGMRAQDLARLKERSGQAEEELKKDLGLFSTLAESLSE
jgi:ppGpp synthetase/RelA/SpoT-type nucleotidyltranferase